MERDPRQVAVEVVGRDGGEVGGRSSMPVNIEARKCLLSFSWKSWRVLSSSLCTSLKVPAMRFAFLVYCWEKERRLTT